MIRHRSFRARTTQVFCCVCQEPLAPSASRARCDILGRYMCARHGLQARRYERNRLLDLQPRLAVLLRGRPELSWMRTMLCPTLTAQLLRWPRDRSTQRLLPLLPYFLPFPAKCQPRWASNVRRQTQCGGCGATFGDDRSNVRPWGNYDLCRRCHTQTRRKHVRAATQFATLAAFVRSGGAWVLPLLHPTLNERVAKHLARKYRPRVAHDPERWI